MNINKHLLEILEERNLVIVDRNTFGLSEEDSRNIQTMDVIKMALEKGFTMCEENLVNEVCGIVTRKISPPLLFHSFPGYLIFPEKINSKSYNETTIYFRRKLIFAHSFFNQSEVYSGRLFERKLVFKPVNTE